MKLRECEISGKAINSKRVCSVGETTLNRYYRTLKTDSKFLRRKSNISEKKKERGCTFFTVQHLRSVMSFFLLLTTFHSSISLSTIKILSVIKASISSVCPRSCGLFRLSSKCFHLSTSEYLLSFFFPRCDQLFSLAAGLLNVSHIILGEAFKNYLADFISGFCPTTLDKDFLSAIFKVVYKLFYLVFNVFISDFVCVQKAN